MENPQTWNRYAYVGNTPLAATDPLGLNSSLRPPLPGNPSGRCGFVGGPAPFEPYSCGNGESNDPRTGTKSWCVLDGVISDCGFIQLEATVNCPQCGPRDIVGVDNVRYLLAVDYFQKTCSGAVSGGVGGAFGNCTTTWVNSGLMPLDELMSIWYSPGEVPRKLGMPGPAVKAQHPQQPSRHYADYLRCATGEFIEENFGDDDKAFATVLANIAPFAPPNLLRGGPFAALAVAAVCDLSVAFKVRRTCSDQIYGGHS